MHDPTWPEGRTNLSPRVCVYGRAVPRTASPVSRNIFTARTGSSLQIHRVQRANERLSTHRQ
eukprot:3987986-Prymnesium_polylepis.1